MLEILEEESHFQLEKFERWIEDIVNKERGDVLSSTVQYLSFKLDEVDMPFQPNHRHFFPPPSLFNPNSGKIELFATLPSNFLLYDNSFITIIRYISIKHERKKHRVKDCTSKIANFKGCNFKRVFRFEVMLG